jgi:hypothetical protein
MKKKGRGSDTLSEPPKRVVFDRRLMRKPSQF